MWTYSKAAYNSARSFCAYFSSPCALQRYMTIALWICAQHYATGFSHCKWMPLHVKLFFCFNLFQPLPHSVSWNSTHMFYVLLNLICLNDEIIKKKQDFPNSRWNTQDMKWVDVHMCRLSQSRSTAWSEVIFLSLTCRKKCLEGGRIIDCIRIVLLSVSRENSCKEEVYRCEDDDSHSSVSCAD